MNSHGWNHLSVDDCTRAQTTIERLMNQKRPHDTSSLGYNDAPMGASGSADKFRLAEFENGAEDDVAHFADYHFSESELEWIEEYYSNTGNFLIAQGLKFYDDEDCKEAAALVRAMMTRFNADPQRNLVFV